MANTIFIRGVPDNLTIKDVRVREAPGLNSNTLFRIPVNTPAICDNVVVDPNGDNYQGQVYKWFHLMFSDGRNGWVRDDLLDMQGDFTALGYGTYANRTFAFAAGQPPAPPVQPTPPSPQTPVGKTGETRPLKEPPAASPKTQTTQIFQTITNNIPSNIPDVPIPKGPDTTISNPGGVAPSVAFIGCDGSVRGDVRAKVRSGPSLFTDQVAVFNSSTPVRIQGVEPGQDGQGFRWVRVTANNVIGYIREDLLTYSANCAQIGLPADQGNRNVAGIQNVSPTPALAPATLNAQVRFGPPLRNKYTVFQEFGTNGHKGIDLDIDVGTPIVASGKGVVAFILRCAKCRSDAPNFGSQGLRFWDSTAINDPAWGYGFGNCVVVRYTWADLPSTMRDELVNQGLQNGFAYVIHGHMSRIDVASGVPVSDGTQLGLSGNTGNSTGPHLHLEVRMSLVGNETTIFNRKVTNPRNMYKL